MTVAPISPPTWTWLSYAYGDYWNTRFEVIRLFHPKSRTKLEPKEFFGQFCYKLKKVIGILSITLDADKFVPFPQSDKLEEIQLEIAKEGISVKLSNKPLLTLESFQFLINNSLPGAVIVHPDVYAKLTDEGNAEWHQLLVDATEKGISFALT